MYALEVGAFVLAPAAVVTAAAWGGAPQPRTTGPTGRARIYAPDGSELVSALPEGERGILYADLEIGASAADSQPCESPESPATARNRPSPAATPAAPPPAGSPGPTAGPSP